MSILASRRSSRHVVFHCPACFADRVGAVRRGRWRAWPDDRPSRGVYFECSGCGNQINPCNVVDSPTATAFSTRLFRGTRSLMASVAASGEPTDEVISAAIESVMTLTPLSYDRAALEEDMAVADRESQLRGDLILLAEQLKPHGCEALLTHATRLASMGGGPTPAQRAVIEHAATYLGCPGFNPGWAPPEPALTRRRARRSRSPGARVRA